MLLSSLAPGRQEVEVFPQLAASARTIWHPAGADSLVSSWDWSLLVETLLQWEMWLKSDSLKRHDVMRARSKHKNIMYLIKKVCNRTKGMGLKLMKFHGILHMAADILHFGVPMEYDTGSNESHHKPTKKAAMLTQKDQKTVHFGAIVLSTVWTKCLAALARKVHRTVSMLHGSGTTTVWCVL